MANLHLTTNPVSIVETVIRTNESLDSTTRYLSTLHAPIEPLEELLSISGLTNSLLQALRSLIRRLELDFHPQQSFLHPLTQDILFALNQLDLIVKDAQSSQIWESSTSAFVNGGRVSWCAVCGNENNARRLRSRFFVEKYRVRVLIDAITWFGLRRIKKRSVEQEKEFQEVEKRLGTIAERLLGVWRDYTPRLQALERGTGEQGKWDLSQMQKQRILELQMGKNCAAPPRYEAMPSSSAAQSSQMANDEKRPLEGTNSCVSCSSPSIPQETYETYLLRQNPPTSTLKTSTRILGFLFSTTTTHTPATHYIKPLPSTLSEINSYRQISLSTFSPRSSASDEETHLRNLRKRIINMPDNAQWEIQKLVEQREHSSLNGRHGRVLGSRREYELCGLVERPRRKINHQSVKKPWFWQKSSSGSPNRVLKSSDRRDKRDQVEWILILRSKVVESRNQEGDGFNGQGREEEIKNLQQRQLLTMRNQAHIQAMKQKEERKKMSKEEVEREMDRMCKDLFRLRDQDIRNEDMDEESGSEDEESACEDIDIDMETDEDENEEVEDEDLNEKIEF